MNDDDWSLLREFVHHRSEAAFATLVARHAGMVYSACLRELRNVHDAEDATQAVFIVLARKAGTIRRGTVIVAWLYRTARFAASHLSRANRRLRAREAMAAANVRECQEHAMDLGTFEDLDRALGKLGRQERAAILLRFFEDRSYEEVAGELNVSVAAAKKRVQRAVERLREMMYGRDGSPMGQATAFGLLAAAGPSPPGHLQTSILNAVFSPGASAGAAGAIAKGTLKLLAWAKAKTAMIVALAALLLVATTATILYSRRPAPAAQSIALPSGTPHVSSVPPVTQSPSDPNSPAGRLDGVWLADAADGGDGASWLSGAWWSGFTLSGDSFVISRFRQTPRPLTGTYTLDAAGPGTLDLKVNEFLFSQTPKFVYPACTLPGLYRIEGNRLTVCFCTGPNAHRPASLQPSGKQEILLKLARAGNDFKGFPADVKVTVLDPAGKPTADVDVCGRMSHLERAAEAPKNGWRYSPRWGTTGADGTVKVLYNELGKSQSQLMAHDGRRKLAGFALVSPVSLQTGSVTIHLAPERLVSGTVTFEAGDKAGKAPSWANIYLLLAGQRIGMCDSFSGQFSFPIPPGTYTLHAYGSQVVQKFVPLTVPPGEGELRLAPIQLAPVRAIETAGVKLEAANQGKPAPEMSGIVGWKGQPVRLADFRGKVVLLNFWSFLNEASAAEMPVMIALHQRYKDKGLAIVGVHIDHDGDIDTAAKLDAAFADARKEYCDGKDLPFPVALVSGKSFRAGKGVARQYGIKSFPWTIIIDRQGKVAGAFGRFGPEDTNKAVGAVERLLKTREEGEHRLAPATAN